MSLRSRLTDDVVRNLLDTAPDAVIVSREGRIELVNAATERLFGYTPAQLLGQPVELLLPERYRAQHVARRAHDAAAPRIGTMGVALAIFGLRRDGTEFPAEISISPLVTPEGLLVTEVIRDVCSTC
jgi:protein-histidine pros-kinase